MPEPLRQRLRRFAARISIRLLAFNLLLVFLPAAGVLYLDVYEERLLAALERAMVQQGRILAAALASNEDVVASARHTLELLDRRTTARLRVLDTKGQLVADSSVLGPREGSSSSSELPDPRGRWLYRVGLFAYNVYSRARGFEVEGSVEETEAVASAAWPEVASALQGRYGAAYRVSPGQRSLTLYSAIPVRRGGEIAGVVLVSQSTLRLLRDLYEVRLAIFEVVVASLVAATLLTLVVATTIVRPLRRLRREAGEILDRRGRLRGRFGGSRRRDEIGDLARALEELSRRLGGHLEFIESFAADVSHEFKNPLASIRSATEMLSEVEAPADRDRLVAVAEREVARLERLLSEVRDVTLLDARQEMEEAEIVPLEVLLSGLREGSVLRREAVRTELVAGVGPLPVRGSPEQLRRAFQNLLDNAISFSPPGGLVRIELARSREGDAVVQIWDQGPGIPPEHLERIFQRFFSFREPDESGRHSGLGLAIVQTIVEAHHGEVRARNHPDGGAELEVRLPLADVAS